VLASTLVSALFAAEFSWRVLFFLGLAPAAWVIYLRRSVPEPMVGASSSTDATTPAKRENFLGIFSPQLYKRTAICALLSIGAQGGYYSLVTFLPQFLAKERGLKIFALGGTLALVITGAFAGYLFGAWLTDKIGRRPMLVSTALAAFLIVFPMTAFTLPVGVFTILCFPLGFFASAYLSAMGSVLAEQFPTAVRGSGMGFSYNFGRGIGALFPFFVGLLAKPLTLGVSIAVFAGLAYGMMIVAALLLTETRGIELADI
jgi:predicted MFS family arabinose efflux permease